MLHIRGLVLVLGLPLVGLAQAYAPLPPPLTVDPCAAQHKSSAAPVDPKAKVVCPPPTAPAPATAPSAAEAFPFPGDAPVKPKTPAALKAADQFPYPGESKTSPDAVPEGNTPRYVPDAPGGKVPGGDDSSSSSSSGGDPASPGDESDKAVPDSTEQPTGRRKLAKVSALSPDERVSEDLDVAKFYSDRGNFQAAYLRTKDATKIMPEDAESHFALARAAEKLRKKDEAAAEYALYLKLDPAGDKTAAAKRALAQLK